MKQYDRPEGPAAPERKQQPVRIDLREPAPTEGNGGRANPPNRPVGTASAEKPPQAWNETRRGVPVPGQEGRRMNGEGVRGRAERGNDGELPDEKDGASARTAGAHPHG